MLTTYLAIENYKAVNTSVLEIRVQNSLRYWVETIRPASIGYNLQNDLIMSTYGKYAQPGIKLTQALLDEHTAELEREQKRLKS